jgi:hypothetical protein
VPLALSKSEPDNAAALAEARAAAQRAAQIQSDSEPVVRLASDISIQRRHPRGMDSKNPFTQQFVPKTASQGAAAAAAGGGSAGAAGGAAGVPQRVGGVPNAPAALPEPTGPSTPPASTPKTKQTTYHVDLSFGEAGAQRSRKDVGQLTALPDGTAPVVVFLGVDKGGKTASFLVTSDATPQGDGKCEPSADNCQYVHMAEGEEEFLDVASGTAGVRQYILKVVSIRRSTSGSAAAASAALRRQSSEGADVIRSEIGPGHISFDAVSGTVSTH